MRCQF